MRKFHMQREPFGRGISVYLSEPSTVQGSIAIATNIMFETIKDHNIPPALMSIDLNEAQQLMDELWHCGIRPTEGAGSAGAMRAVENHLADLRTITKNLLKIEG